jgi:hypothetical protein
MGKRRATTILKLGGSSSDGLYIIVTLSSRSTHMSVVSAGSPGRKHPTCFSPLRVMLITRFGNLDLAAPRLKQTGAGETPTAEPSTGTKIWISMRRSHPRLGPPALRSLASVRGMRHFVIRRLWPSIKTRKALRARSFSPFELPLLPIGVRSAASEPCDHRSGSS